MVKNFPNFLTLLNLFLGCMAIVYLYNDHMVIMSGERNMFIDMGQIQFSCYCVLLAALIDFMDGFVARLLKAESKLGKQLDSLADIVTFGVVPGLILYELLARSYYANYNAFDYPVLFYTIGFSVTLCGAFRLAKFNVDERQSETFRGLPIPSMAVVVVALPLMLLHNELNIASLLSSNWFLIGLAVVLSYLMVSDIRMMSLKIKSLKFEENEWLFGLILISVAVIFLGIFVFNILFGIIPMIIFIYILLSITKNIKENGI